MRSQKPMVRAQCLSWALFLTFIGCNESQFGSGKGEKKASRDEAAAVTEDLGEPAEGGNENGEDQSDPADEPAMVAGSFLTCQQDPALPGTSAEHTGVGCVLQRDGKKVSLVGLTAAWSIMNLFNEDVAATFDTAEPASPYHSSIALLRKDLPNLRVRLDISKGQMRSTFVTAIGEATQTSGSNKSGIHGSPIEGHNKYPTWIKSQVFGASGDFRLGNGTYAAPLNFDCLHKLQAIEVSGESLVIGFRVEADEHSKVGIMLEELCGVSVGSNRVTIYRDGKKTYEEAIPAGANRMVLRGFRAEQGATYRLEISSIFNKIVQDYDDFVVGRVVFISSQALNFDPITVSSESMADPSKPTP